MNFLVIAIPKEGFLGGLKVLKRPIRGDFDLQKGRPSIPGGVKSEAQIMRQGTCTTTQLLEYALKEADPSFAISLI